MVSAVHQSRLSALAAHVTLSLKTYCCADNTLSAEMRFMGLDLFFSALTLFTAAAKLTTP